MDNPKSAIGRTIEWIFRASLLLLGATIALNLAVDYLQPLLPWLIGTFALASVIVIVILIVRWRRSKW